MARQGVNKAVILGNLGQDPETRYMPNGNAVTNISVATSESWKDKNTGQDQERTEWHRVIFFNRLAEIAGEYLRKGSKVYVEGSLRTRKWQDQNGIDRYTTEIVASELQMLDSKPSGDSEPHQGQYYRQPTQQTHQHQSHPQDGSARRPPPPRSAPQQGQQQPPHYDAPPPGYSDFEDDIPF